VSSYVFCVIPLLRVLTLDFFVLAGVGYIPTTGLRPTPVLVRFPARYAQPETGCVRLTHITAGDRHSLALDDRNQLYTWGFNESGCTGHITGEDDDVFIPRKLDLLPHLPKNGKKVHEVKVYGMSGGGQHSLVLCKRFAPPS